MCGSAATNMAKNKYILRVPSKKKRETLSAPRLRAINNNNNMTFSRTFYSSSWPLAGIWFIFWLLVVSFGLRKFIRLAKIAHKLNLCFMSVVLAAVLFPVLFCLVVFCFVSVKFGSAFPFFPWIFFFFGFCEGVSSFLD